MSTPALPARLPAPEASDEPVQAAYFQGWNACLDACASLLNAPEPTSTYPRMVPNPGTLHPCDVTADALRLMRQALVAHACSAEAAARACIEVERVAAVHLATARRLRGLATEVDDVHRGRGTVIGRSLDEPRNEEFARDMLELRRRMNGAQHDQG